MYNGKISCGKTMHLDTHCIVHAMSLYYRLGTGRYMTDNWVLRVPNKFVKGWRALGYTIRKSIKIGWKTKVWKVDLLIKTLCFRSISIVNIKRKMRFFLDWVKLDEWKVWKLRCLNPTWLQLKLVVWTWSNIACRRGWEKQKASWSAGLLGCGRSPHPRQAHR